MIQAWLIIVPLWRKTFYCRLIILLKAESCFQTELNQFEHFLSELLQEDMNQGNVGTADEKQMIKKSCATGTFKGLCCEIFQFCPFHYKNAIWFPVSSPKVVSKMALICPEIWIQKCSRCVAFCRQSTFFFKLEQNKAGIIHPEVE